MASPSRRVTSITVPLCTTRSLSTTRGHAPESGGERGAARKDGESACVCQKRLVTLKSRIQASLPTKLGQRLLLPGFSGRSRLHPLIVSPGTVLT
jgi:hypothetical protein